MMKDGKHPPSTSKHSPTSGTSSRSSSIYSSKTSLDYFNWHEKRQRLFIYWCFTHFIHGMIHSIRYSSQYLYFKDVMQVKNPDFLYGLSVSFMGVTGVIFPLFISPYIDRTRDIKKAILMVNAFGIIGNLFYSLPFHPILPLIGQLFAGTTPAFGVIAMGEISRCYSSENLTKRVSALSLIYSVGTFTSIGLVFCFLYVDFYIGEWHINYADMPGLFLSVAFTVSMLLSFLLVSDVSKEFDLKLEERIKRSSGGSTPKSNLSAKTTPSTSQRNSPAPIPKVNIEHVDKNRNGSLSNMYQNEKGYLNKLDKEESINIYDITNGKVNHATTDKNIKLSPFSFPSLDKNKYKKLNQEDYSSEEEEEQKSDCSNKSCEAARTTFHFIWKILCYKETAILMAITFMEAFIYSIIVTSLPVIASNYLNWGKVELAVLSMVNKFLSVIISGSIYFLTDYLHDFLLLIYGALFSSLALLTLCTLHLLKDNEAAVTVLLFIVAALSISGVPLVITSTRSMLAKIVPTEIQSLAEAVRMSVFEASFVPAGFLVPLIMINISVTAVLLLFLMSCVILVAVRNMKSLVELKEEDDYWQIDQSNLIDQSNVIP